MPSGADPSAPSAPSATMDSNKRELVAELRAAARFPAQAMACVPIYMQTLLTDAANEIELSLVEDLSMDQFLDYVRPGGGLNP